MAYPPLKTPRWNSNIRTLNPTLTLTWTPEAFVYPHCVGMQLNTLHYGVTNMKIVAGTGDTWSEVGSQRSGWGSGLGVRIRVRGRCSVSVWVGVRSRGQSEDCP